MKMINNSVIVEKIKYPAPRDGGPNPFLAGQSLVPPI